MKRFFQFVVKFLPPHRIEKFRSSQCNTSYQVCTAAPPWLSAGTTDWRSGPWFSWKLCTMPHCNNPNDIDFNFIKKSIRRYNNLSVGKFWKFRYDSSGFRKVLKSSQDFFGLISKTDCCRRFILPNV